MIIPSSNKKQAYLYRISQGVWINDLRNTPMTNQEWPCISLDQQSLEDIKNHIQFQSDNGFDFITLFGLLTANDWLPNIENTINSDRKTKIKALLEFSKTKKIKILYGLGVFSWGFNQIIIQDPTVRGTNLKVLCGTQPSSWKWMKKVIHYLVNEYEFDGFHLEAADMGRCDCLECSKKNNSQYFCEITTKTAAYIRKTAPNKTLLASLCGYLPPGNFIPEQDWYHYQSLSKNVDCLIDPGHFGTFIPLSQRKKFIQQLHCTFGNAGGTWLYPPQQWDRLRYFIPHTQRTGKYIESLYQDGGRTIEYNAGPIINPAIEVNIAFGGRKLNDVTRDSREILLEVIAELYQPKNYATTLALTIFFETAENVFFNVINEAGEIHLTYLFGGEICIPTYLTNSHIPTEHQWYLTKPITIKNKTIYKKSLKKLYKTINELESNIGNQLRLNRIKTCLKNILKDIQHSNKTNEDLHL